MMLLMPFAVHQVRAHAPSHFKHTGEEGDNLIQIDAEHRHDITVEAC